MGWRVLSLDYSQLALARMDVKHVDLESLRFVKMDLKIYSILKCLLHIYLESNRLSSQYSSTY